METEKKEHLGKVDALVLAGGTLKGVSEKVPSRGLVKIKDKPMLKYVIDALKSSKLVERIVVVLPSSVSAREWEKEVDGVVISDGSLTENIYEGAKFLKTDSPILVLSSDIPLITPSAIDNFIEDCSGIEAKVYYPIISKEVMERAYPEAKRTYAKLKDGVYTGGNLALFDPKVILENIELIERVYNLRKSVLGLAGVLGIKFIVKFLLGRLALKEIEKRASELIGAKGVAVVTSYPEIGMDVDKDSDLELVRKVIH